jgi:hypothetical protein
MAIGSPKAYYCVIKTIRRERAILMVLNIPALAIIKINTQSCL